MNRQQRLRYIFQILAVTIIAGSFPGCSRDKPEAPVVLFLCPHNASKSIMAAAHFERLSAERGLAVDATSAGTHPGEAVDPRVIELLGENGVVVEDHTPVRVTVDQMKSAFRVISLGCDPNDLPSSGTPIVRWDEVPLPSLDLRAAHDDIVARVEALVAELSR